MSQDEIQDYLLETASGGLYHDNVPFIWKWYQALGYATFNMDFSESLQFQEKPTHHYVKILEHAMHTEELVPPLSTPKQNTKCWSQTCQGQWYTRKKTDVLLDFLKVYQKKKFFAYAFYNILTHDNERGMKLMREQVYEIFAFLKDMYLYRNTIVIFFSDHGIRTSSVVFSDRGFYEVRLPFVYIILPEIFKRKYQRKYKILQTNVHKLTSHFDIHATLKTLISNKVDIKYTPKWGQSLFSVIKSSRTCAEAGIPSHWCACGIQHQIPTNSSMILKVLVDSIEGINSLLGNRLPGMCQTYALHQLFSAKVSILKGLAKLNFEKIVPLNDKIALTFQVRPSKALFRITVSCQECITYSFHGQSQVVSDELVKRNGPSDTGLNSPLSPDSIERLDEYGNQSRCISKLPQAKDLKHLCLCK